MMGRADRIGAARASSEPQGVVEVDVTLHDLHEAAALRALDYLDSVDYLDAWGRHTTDERVALARCQNRIWAAVNVATAQRDTKRPATLRERLDALDQLFPSQTRRPRPMKPHHAAVLALLHPAPETPPAPTARRDPETGRFIAPPGVTLAGGVGYSPLPSPPRDHEAEHRRMLADALAPRDLGA